MQGTSFNLHPWLEHMLNSFNFGTSSDYFQDANVLFSVDGTSSDMEVNISKWRSEVLEYMKEDPILIRSAKAFGVWVF